MPTLTIPNLSAAALARLRAAAERSGRTVEEEARDRLAAPPAAAREAGRTDVDDADRLPLGRSTPRLGPMEHPEGLPPRRYSATMSEERKRLLERSERRTRERAVPHVPIEELEAWIAEGRE